MAPLVDPESQENMAGQIPLHPLPEEIQKMPHDETVCKYCGISYLILHEFKNLEDKIKAMEKEMKFYQGSVEREKMLQDELKRLNQQYEQSRTDSESKAERLQVVMLQLKLKEDEVQQLTKERTYCQQQVKVAKHEQHMLGERVTKQHAVLKKTLPLLKCLQSEQMAIKKGINTTLEIWKVLEKEIRKQVEKALYAFSTEITTLNEHLTASQAEELRLQAQVKNLKDSSDSSVSTMQQLHALRQIEKELKINCHELQEKITDLEKQLETAELNLQNATNEIQHHKEISIVKSTEVSDCQTQLRRLEYEKEKNETRLAKELREREDSLAQIQQTIRQLHEEISEKERREECIKRKDKLLENELETMKEVLNQTQEETITLKQERELTIVSYQNTFEQLQEALRQKMQSEDGWKAKLEAELENERHKYLLRLEERENKLKEETNIELDIERQKHEELIRKFQKQQVELDEKIPMLIAKAREELQTEIRILEKKLQETQARLTDKDLAKESEIRNLKKIISDLESRLKKEQCKNNSVLEETRKDAFAKSEERKELTQQIAELRHQLDQANQENELLKETVRMECEERYELTEALTQAKEQLLEQKRLSGNFPSPQRSFISDRSMSSQAVTNAGQKSIMSLSSSKESKITGVPGNSGSVFTSQYRKSSSTSLPALLSQQPSNLRNRTSSVSDAKKKITAVLRSHSTQP